MTVALATAAGGEGDLASDKLSNLRTVGSGFASLIYEVKVSDDYQMLQERCRSLWDALAKNSKLPQLLVRFVACIALLIINIYLGLEKLQQ